MVPAWSIEGLLDDDRESAAVVVFADEAVDVVGGAGERCGFAFTYRFDVVVNQVDLHLVPHALQRRLESHFHLAYVLVLVSQ
jgi:hypothetical protein